MKILLGTSNPARASWLKELLTDEVECITLNEINLDIDIEETGTTPEENAYIKALEYGKYYDIVLTGDTGLFFDNFPLDDYRQPKTKIRRVNGKVLNDEEMINYYSNLAHENGGKLFGYYLNGYAVSYFGKVYTYSNLELCKKAGFYLLDKPCAKRHVGWPLDSLCVDLKNNEYFVNGYVNEYLGLIDKEIRDFVFKIIKQGK